MFEGETLVVHPSRPKGELEIELRPPKNASVDVHVKVCVGPAGADLLQVHVTITFIEIARNKRGNGLLYRISIPVYKNRLIRSISVVGYILNYKKIVRKI